MALTLALAAALRIRSTGRRESVEGGSTATSLRQTPAHPRHRSAVQCLL